MALAEQIEHPFAVLAVERAGRFVNEPHIRLVHQEPGEAEPLEFASGEALGRPSDRNVQVSLESLHG